MLEYDSWDTCGISDFLHLFHGIKRIEKKMWSLFHSLVSGGKDSFITSASDTRMELREINVVFIVPKGSDSLSKYSCVWLNFI